MIQSDARPSRSEAFWAAVGRGLVRCVVLAVALVVSVSVVGLVTMVVGALATSAAPTPDPNAVGLDWILIIVLYWPTLGLFCFLLGAPFLLFQNWIVKPHFPFLRWGYLAVTIYGPLLLALWAWPWTDTSTYWVVIAYEVVALGGTMLYARIGRSAGVFDAELPAEPGAQK